MELQQLKAKNHGLNTQMDALAADHERLGALLAAAEKVMLLVVVMVVVVGAAAGDGGVGGGVGVVSVVDPVVVHRFLLVSWDCCYCCCRCCYAFRAPH